MGEAAREHEDQHMERDEINQEHVSTPGGDLRLTEVGITNVEIHHWLNITKQYSSHQNTIHP